jgi:peptidoglycan/xylan/chitin deacetylase (PgdA/CDA1 family)
MTPKDESLSILRTPFCRWNRRLLFISNLAAPVAVAWTGFQSIPAISFAIVVHAFLLLALLYPGCALLGPLVVRFAPSGRQLWLTLDDGPIAGETRQLAEALAARGAKATFFLEGRRAEELPAAVAAIVANGHQIGNHTYSHPKLSFWCLSPWRLQAELDRFDQTLSRLGVLKVALFRSPVGMCNVRLAPQLERGGRIHISWSIRGLDGIQCDPQQVIRRIRKAVRPGSIILLHEGKLDAKGRAASRECILQLVDDLQTEGYEFVIPEPTSYRCDLAPG